jgi:hypothetical protein
MDPGDRVGAWPFHAASVYYPLSLCLGESP